MIETSYFKHIYDSCQNLTDKRIRVLVIVPLILPEIIVVDPRTRDIN